MGRKSYLGPGEITSFSSLDFSRSNKCDIFWHVVSIGYFCVYEPLLLQIEICYNVKSVFWSKYTLRFFTALIFYSFSVDYVKVFELHVVHTWRHMQSE